MEGSSEKGTVVAAGVRGWGCNGGGGGGRERGG